MNKFGDLPGIDYNGQEVLESSDVEAEDQIHNSLQEEDAEPAINFTQLQTQFSEIEISNDKYDLSRNPLNYKRFPLGTRKETKHEKLARIKRELEELQREESEEGEDTDTDTDTESHKAEDLLRMFQALNAAPDRQVFPKEEELKIKEILIPPPEPTKATSQQIAQLVSLENKLHQLEKQLGIDTSLQHPVQHSLNSITRHLDLINHADFNLESIKSKIESTGKEMEKLELQKRLFGWEDPPTPKTDKIDELYKILPDLKKYCGIAPSIAERIKGLNQIHAELEESIHFSSNLNQFISDLAQDMKHWDKSLEALNRGLDTSMESFETNKSRLESRLGELEKRMPR
ncbi:hypothetical protein KGF57_004973 [Candida theae]|uniref:Dynactin subunit 2 n=1 Tax=Candida theae TaxID=1198502 RepID=A0AAD5BAA9_9ASCO|nr:uncharacterized protein KGF57_004973 [Candida theae]KAI5949143.1 hypothetical protein KGF57_004973 [Candida theae]